jgi:hypothetical protein
VWDGIKPGFWDSPNTLNASTIGSVFDPFKSSFNLFQGFFARFHQAQGKFLLKIVAPHVGHVDGHAGQLTARFRTVFF